MKKLIVLSSIVLALVSCSNEDKADQYCGTVIGVGHEGTHDFVVILKGTEQKKFIITNASAYPLHSYQCK